MTPRSDHRIPTQARTPKFEFGFHHPSEGSVLYRAGNTVVLCTASIESKLPPFLEGQGRGWITAEYQMHPRANLRREQREGRSKSISGRTQEIQRLIGRALRASIVLEKLGERQLTIDCDILEADGGTRTASVTGGFVAMLLAIDKLTKDGVLTEPCVRAQVASVSVGMVANEMLLDLVYVEDSRAQMDLNLVATSGEQIIEVQGTAEGAPIARSAFDSMIDLAMQGVLYLCDEQKKALQAAGIDFARLMVKV